MWLTDLVVGLAASANLLQLPILQSNDTSPIAKLQYGTVIGRKDGEMDNFVGVPYALPPIGSQRLRLPRPIRDNFGTLVLPEEQTACMQALAGDFDVSKLGFKDEVAQVMGMIVSPYPGPQSEDCLTLTITRPSGTSSTAKLPVLVFVHGGGFQAGSAALYNGTAIVKESVDRHQTIIYVAINYRLNGFGFLPGQQAQRDGVTNLGLRDQRLALEWVADNIAAFGGNPEKVTIWGHSAGAMSVYSHLTINGGDHRYNGKPLFRAAIMNSGSIVPALSVESPKAQGIFDTVANTAGCLNEAQPLNCLRRIPRDIFTKAINSIPEFFRFQYLSFPYLMRPDTENHFYPFSPDIATSAQDITRVPMIIGEQEDDGTVFTLLNNLSSDADIRDYLTTFYPIASPKVIDKLLELYPSKAAFGAPFRTDNNNQFYPKYKQIAAIMGDLTIAQRRRQALAAASRSGDTPLWSFVSTYRHDLELLGTYHLSDLTEMFFLTPNATLGSQLNARYVNFVNHLDPNVDGLTHWPQYDETTKSILNISAMEATLRKDDYREKQFAFVKQKSFMFAV